MKLIQAFPTLALPLVLLASAMQVNAAPYDPTATSGGLQTVCTLFSINSQAVMRAHCNKVIDGAVSDIVATFDLSAEIDSACMDDMSLRVTDTAVYLEGNCKVGNTTIFDSDDLNTIMEWSTSTGTFSWKSGYGPGT